MLIDYALEFFSNKNVQDDAFGDQYVPLGTTASQANSGGGAGAVGGSVAADIGKGEPLFAYARVGTAFDTCTSIDIEIGYADYSAGTNFAAVLSKKTILVAALTANTFIGIGSLPPTAAANLHKVLVCKITVNGANNGAGTITVGLRPDRDGFPQNDVFSAL